MIAMCWIYTFTLTYYCIGGVYDQTRAAQHFLRKFREGQLGHVTLDNESLGRGMVNSNLNT